MIGIKWLDFILVVGFVLCAYKFQNTKSEPFVYFMLINQMIQYVRQHVKGE